MAGNRCQVGYNNKREREKREATSERHVEQERKKGKKERKKEK